MNKFRAGHKLMIWETKIGRIEINHQILFARTRASENRIFVMVANTCGQQTGGNSLIANPTGLIPAAAFQGIEQAATQIEIASARCKDVVPGSNVIKDRVPGIYKELWKSPVK